MRPIPCASKTHCQSENFCPRGKLDLWLTMILPSDDNSTPRKKPGKRKPDPPATPPHLPEPFQDEEAEETWYNVPEAPDKADTAAWRELLKSELINCVEDLENFPDPEIDFDPPDPPDLFTFYSQLLALREDISELAPAASVSPISTAVAVKLGLLAGEMKAAGQEDFAARLLDLIEEITD